LGDRAVVASLQPRCFDVRLRSVDVGGTVRISEARRGAVAGTQAALRRANGASLQRLELRL